MIGKNWQSMLISWIRSALASILGDFCRWVIRSPPTPKPRNPIPTGRIPSLGRAIARVSRAEEHLADFVRKVAQRGQEQFDAITFNPDPNNPQQFIINEVQLPLDFSFSILVGEIVYNLRSALDYLVFELAGLDSGYLIEGTQFPIEDKKKGFKWCIQGGWLDGLNSAHIAAIEALQPYRGCDWTAVLRNLSNPDKHIHLLPSRADHEFTFHSADADHVADLMDIPGAVHDAVMSDGTKVYVKAMLTTSIQFLDGTPVIEALEILKSEVARVLEAFKPDFERAQGGLHKTPSLP